MIEYVEDLIPGFTGVFLQGAAGDINPRFVGGLDGAVDDLERTADLGYEIGEEVVRVFHEIRTDEPLNPKILLASKEIECPLKYNHVIEDFRKTTTFVPTTVIKIDELTLVTFPGDPAGLGYMILDGLLSSCRKTCQMNFHRCRADRTPGRFLVTKSHRIPEKS